MEKSIVHETMQSRIAANFIQRGYGSRRPDSHKNCNFLKIDYNMQIMDGINELIDLVKEKSWLKEKISTAVYACAGTDTKAFTFTHPDFYKHLGIKRVPSPNLFIYIDSRRNSELSFEDDATRISFVEEIKKQKIFDNAGIYRLYWESKKPKKWGALRPRDLAIIYISADWRDCAQLFRKENFVPDTFIGVTDGCRWGGNPECVNLLAMKGVSPDVLKKIPVSKYYITDHFENARIPNPMPKGSYVRSNEEDFPLRFKKIAFLSSEWGNYADKRFGGTTLFAVQSIRQNARNPNSKK